MKITTATQMPHVTILHAKYVYSRQVCHTERQECRLCGYEKEVSVHTVCDCPVLACKRYRILGCMFLNLEDLEKVRVSSLLSLVANTGHGLVS
jgi:hypothetical protein